MVNHDQSHTERAVRVIFKKFLRHTGWTTLYWGMNSPVIWEAMVPMHHWQPYQVKLADRKKLS